MRKMTPFLSKKDMVFNLTWALLLLSSEIFHQSWLLCLTVTISGHNHCLQPSYRNTFSQLQQITSLTFYDAPRVESIERCLWIFMQLHLQAHLPVLIPPHLPLDPREILLLFVWLAFRL